jgi:hypothetical protein
VVRAAVLDDPDPPRGNLLVHAVIELDDGVRDVFLESVTRQRVLAPLSRNHDREVSIPQPAEQPAQLRPQDRLVLQAAEQRFDRVEDDALRADRTDGMIEAYEQALEVVLPCFLDFAAVDVDVIHGQAPLLDEPGEVVAERGDVLREFPRVLLEAHQYARLPELQRPVHEERDAEKRFPRSRPAAHEGGTTGWQTATRDFVQARNAGKGLPQGWSLHGCVSHGINRAQEG